METDELNKVLNKYSTLKQFCIKNRLNLSSVYKLLKKNEIEFLMIDGRTKLYFVNDLLKLTEKLIMKRVIKEKVKTLHNKNLLGYRKREIRLYEPE
jgi:hypothetical protein